MASASLTIAIDVHELKRLSDALLNVPEEAGTRFTCPSCQSAVTDRWVLVIEHEHVIRCPNCKKKYKVQLFEYVKP